MTKQEKKELLKLFESFPPAVRRWVAMGMQIKINREADASASA